MPCPPASVSLDLDNKWSYLKTHGDAGWEEFPSYLPVLIPRVLQFLQQRDLRITFFIVGQDAARTENHALLRSVVDAGHEIGNHSFHHEPWLHLYSPAQLRQEFDLAEQAIQQATGQCPAGFRGPGFSFSPNVLRLLSERGYEYDGSTFPTFLGPLARAYYFFTARLDGAERNRRKALFGKFTEGFRPLRPYRWSSLQLPLIEIPVTTMPVFRVPIHLSYVLYLARFSRHLAVSYFRWALRLCRLFRVQPSILLHPLDFLGQEDDQDLSFFPAMDLTRQYKLDVAAKVFADLIRHFEVVTMREHAQRFAACAGREKR
jgi:hypothetical protein